MSPLKFHHYAACLDRACYISWQFLDSIVLVHKDHQLGNKKYLQVGIFIELILAQPEPVAPQPNDEPISSPIPTAQSEIKLEPSIEPTQTLKEEG